MLRGIPKWKLGRRAAAIADRNVDYTVVALHAGDQRVLLLLDLLNEVATTSPLQAAPLSTTGRWPGIANERRFARSAA